MFVKNTIDRTVQQNMSDITIDDKYDVVRFSMNQHGRLCCFRSLLHLLSVTYKAIPIYDRTQFTILGERVTPANLKS